MTSLTLEQQLATLLGHTGSITINVDGRGFAVGEAVGYTVAATIGKRGVIGEGDTITAAVRDAAAKVADLHREHADEAEQAMNAHRAAARALVDVALAGDPPPSDAAWRPRVDDRVVGCRGRFDGFGGRVRTVRAASVLVDFAAHGSSWVDYDEIRPVAEERPAS